MKNLDLNGSMTSNKEWEDKVMTQYIDKSAVMAEIERRLERIANTSSEDNRELSAIRGAQQYELIKLVQYIDTLEVKDLYEQCVQYDSIKAGIQAHAETYSFNIESMLFQQLTKEQQKLWRKEIEQAVISGGDAGYLLAKDTRYKENLEVKDVDLEKEIQQHINDCLDIKFPTTDIKTIAKDVEYTARKFFELGLKA